MVDSSDFAVIEAGLEVPAGQGRRQLDLAQGRRGQVPRAGAQGPPLRRRRRRDGVRRGRPGDDAPSASVADPAARLPDPDRGDRLPRRGHHLRPERAHGRAPGSRSTTDYAVAFIEATRQLKALFPLAKVLGGISQRLVRVPRQRTPCARRCTRPSSTTRSQAGLDMGIVNAGQLAVYEEIPKDLLERVEDVLLNRRARRDGAARRLRADRPATRQKGRAAEDEWRRGPGRGAPDARARPRHRRATSTPTPRRRGSKYGRPLAVIEGPLMDGHERGRRPVRRGQDVPAAGGEERPRDEEGRRLPDAVHGGGEAGERRPRAAAKVVHGDGQGRRPRHRQEHRRRGAGLQQTTR